MTAAKGHFVHIYIDRQQRRPTQLSAQLKTVLEAMQ